MMNNELWEKFWEIAERADWRLMPVESKAFAVGAFVVAAVLILGRIRMWRRMRRIESQLRAMEKKIALMDARESGRLMRLMKEFNAKSRVKGDTRDASVELSSGGNVVGLTVSPPTAPAQGDSAKSAKLTG
jgi:hypothetical protein